MKNKTYIGLVDMRCWELHFDLTLAVKAIKMFAAVAINVLTDRSFGKLSIRDPPKNQLVLSFPAHSVQRFSVFLQLLFWSNRIPFWQCYKLLLNCTWLRWIEYHWKIPLQCEIAIIKHILLCSVAIDFRSSTCFWLGSWKEKTVTLATFTKLIRVIDISR